MRATVATQQQQSTKMRQQVLSAGCQVFRVAGVFSRVLQDGSKCSGSPKIHTITHADVPADSKSDFRACQMIRRFQQGFCRCTGVFQMFRCYQIFRCHQKCCQMFRCFQQGIQVFKCSGVFSEGLGVSGVVSRIFRVFQMFKCLQQGCM